MQNQLLENQKNLMKEDALKELETLTHTLKKELNERINKGINVADEFYPDLLFWTQRVRLLPYEKAMADMFIFRTKRYYDDKLIPGE